MVANPGGRHGAENAGSVNAKIMGPEKGNVLKTGQGRKRQTLQRYMPD